MIAKTPPPSYYAVIFTSQKTANTDGYNEMSEKMIELAKTQPGYLGFESAGGDLGISVSYWKDLDSIRSWKSNIDHLFAQTMGKEKWYSAYKTRIAKVERDYEFKK